MQYLNGREVKVGDLAAFADDKGQVHIGVVNILSVKDGHELMALSRPGFPPVGCDNMRTIHVDDLASLFPAHQDAQEQPSKPKKP